MAIGNNISMIMGKRRETIKEVERATGISYTTLRDLYHGRTSQISFKVLDKLCQHFEVDPNDLFPYVKDEKS